MARPQGLKERSLLEIAKGILNWEPYYPLNKHLAFHGGEGISVVTISVILVDKAGILNFQHYRNKAPLTKNLPQMPRAPLRDTINTLPCSRRLGK